MLELVAENDSAAEKGCLEEELARARVALEQERFARDLLETSRRRLERRVSQLEAERAILQGAVEERDRHVADILHSRSWRLIQGVRSLLFLRW